MWLGLTWIYFFAACLVHAVFCRCSLPGNSVVKFLGAGSLTGLGLINHEFHLYGHGTRAVSSVILYAFICELYLFLFTFVGTSVSASLLFKLRGKAMSLDDI